MGNGNGMGKGKGKGNARKSNEIKLTKLARCLNCSDCFALIR
jgi:hypothetical protein